MRPWLEEKFANPHSPAQLGRAKRRRRSRSRGSRSTGDRLRRRKRRLHRQRDRGAQLGAEGHGRESADGRNRIVTVATEHAAVLDTCEWLAGQGHRSDDAAGRAGRPGRPRAASSESSTTGVLLVAAMLVNNEIGVIQPIAEIAAHGARGRRVDAVRCGAGLGRVDDSAKAPTSSRSPRTRSTGPRGSARCGCATGASRRRCIHGGGQERGLRSGTLSPALCVGLRRGGEARCRALRPRLRPCPAAVGRRCSGPGPGWTINGSIAHRYHGNLNIRRDGVDAARLIADLRGLAFSARFGLRQRIRSAEPRASRTGSRLS